TVQGRQRTVAVAEPLHAAAFLVDADELRAWGGFADRLRELGDLGAGGEVAGEQDDAGAGVVLQPVAFLGGEFVSGDADYQHGLSARKARSYGVGGVNRAMDSTWAVWGNMSMTPAASSFQPRSLTR